MGRIVNRGGWQGIYILRLGPGLTLYIYIYIYIYIEVRTRVNSLASAGIELHPHTTLHHYN